MDLDGEEQAILEQGQDILRPIVVEYLQAQVRFCRYEMANDKHCVVIVPLSSFLLCQPSFQFLMPFAVGFLIS